MIVPQSIAMCMGNIIVQYYCCACSDIPRPYGQNIKVSKAVVRIKYLYAYRMHEQQEKSYYEVVLAEGEFSKDQHI